MALPCRAGAKAAAEPARAKERASFMVLIRGDLSKVARDKWWRRFSHGEGRGERGETDDAQKDTSMRSRLC